MAQTKKGTITKVRVNNKTDTVVNKVVELMVVDNQLVPDTRDTNPGVVQTKAP